MQTIEEQITTHIAVKFAVLPKFEKQAYAGIDRFRRNVPVSGVQKIAMQFAESLRSFVVFDGDRPLRAVAIASFIAEVLEAVPIEMRRQACHDQEARGRMASLIAAEIVKRYRPEPLLQIGPASHPNWNAIFDREYGSAGDEA